MTVPCIHQNPETLAHPVNCTEMIGDVLKFDSKKTEQTEHRQQFPVIRHGNYSYTNHDCINSHFIHCFPEDTTNEFKQS